MKLLLNTVACTTSVYVVLQLAVLLVHPSRTQILTKSTRFYKNIKFNYASPALNFDVEEYCKQLTGGVFVFVQYANGTRKAAKLQCQDNNRYVNCVENENVDKPAVSTDTNNGTLSCKIPAGASLPAPCRDCELYVAPYEENSAGCLSPGSVVFIFGALTLIGTLFRIE